MLTGQEERSAARRSLQLLDSTPSAGTALTPSTYIARGAEELV